MRVLVTGGAGLIGSNTVDALLERGHDVRVLDNFATGHRRNLAHCAADIELVEGDIRDLEAVERAVSGIERVLHLAALPSVPRSIEAPITSHEVNAGGTLNVLTAAWKVNVQRVVYASSSSVYGNGTDLPKSEEMTPNPLSPYAVSKLAGEHFCRVFRGIHGMETLSLRYFNVFGPRQDPASAYSGVVARFVTAALAGGALTVCGDGSQARDFTYVANVVDANIKALEGSAGSGEVINVACGEMVTVRQLASMTAEIVGIEPELRFEAARTGDVALSCADISRAAALLGYAPSVGVREGLARTIEWYRAGGSA